MSPRELDEDEIEVRVSDALPVLNTELCVILVELIRELTEVWILDEPDEGNVE